MASTARASGGLHVRWFTVLVLAGFVGFGGGGTTPRNLKFKVHGLDTVRAGEKLSLNCHVEGDAARLPSYMWFKDGKVIPGQHDTFLRFKAVKRDDAGLYQCGAPGSDVGGEGRQLHVVVPGDRLPMPVIFKKGFPVSGRPFSLDCIVGKNYIASHDTQYSWYKNDAEVNIQPGQTLNFPNVTEADEGSFTCTTREGAKNTTSPHSHKYDLKPWVSPSVFLELPNADLEVKGTVGQVLNLTCKVSKANPRVPIDGYSWSYLPSPQGQLRPLVENASTLTLGPLTREDSGQYFCQARNDRGFENLHLIGKAFVNVSVVYLESLSLTPDIDVYEGDNVTFVCRVDSHPTARIAWSANGQEIRHVTYNVDHYVIPSAACSDSNNYTCAASNPDLPGLEINATVQLTVLCEQAVTEAHTTELHTTEPHTTTNSIDTAAADKESGNTIWKPVANVCTAILVLILVSVVILVLYWRGQTEDERRKLLEKVVTYLCPVQCKDSSGNQTVLEMEENTEEESPATARTPLLRRDTGATPSPTTPVATAAEKRTEDKGQMTEDFEGSLLRQPAEQIPRQQKSTFEPSVEPSPEKQKVKFDHAYRNGEIYELPERKDDSKQLPAIEDMESKKPTTFVIELLRQMLLATTRPTDPPIFLCTQSLPCHMDAIIYHKVCGVIIIKTNALKSGVPGFRSCLKRVVKDLQEAKTRLQNALQHQLNTKGITLLLALPNLEEDRNISDKIEAWLQNKGVQFLPGKTASKYQTWLETLARTEVVWGPGGNSHEVFKTAVSKYLSMMSYGNSEDPPSWLVTPQQASVLHCSNKLLHLEGPPGSGKTLLLLDRVQRWLLRGKIVVLMAFSSSMLLLHHCLNRLAVSREFKGVASRLEICYNGKELRQKISTLKKKSSSICVAIDNMDAQYLPTLLRACRSPFVECIWSTSRANFPKSEEFEKLGGFSISLTYSLRCSKMMLQLARDLLPLKSLHETFKWISFPSSFDPSAVNKSEHHSSHFGYKEGAPLNVHCRGCNDWLKKSLRPLFQEMPLDKEQWNHWVVLLTGRWGPGNKLREEVVDWLRGHGIPAVLSTSDHGSRVTNDRSMAQAKGESCVDKGGSPAVHVMRGSQFKGLEKLSILVVHYDWRDGHPDHQRKKDRDFRRLQQELFEAMTRSGKNLAVLFLTPPPAVPIPSAEVSKGRASKPPRVAV